MKENRMLPIGTETFRIFVDEAEDGVIRGRVSGGTLPEETLFRSLSRLILLLEEQLDTGGAPKASPIKCTETPTFELDILFRQNYSWQGRLRWTKGGKEAAFRSVLELLIHPTLLNTRDVENQLGMELLGEIPERKSFFRKLQVFKSL